MRENRLFSISVMAEKWTLSTWLKSRGLIDTVLALGKKKCQIGSLLSHCFNVDQPDTSTVFRSGLRLQAAG